jgi:hypothetical protein
MSLTHEFKIAMALFEISLSGAPALDLVAIHLNMSLTNEFKMTIALFEILVSGAPAPD